MRDEGHESAIAFVTSHFRSLLPEFNTYLVERITLDGQFWTARPPFYTVNSEKISSIFSLGLRLVMVL